MTAMRSHFAPDNIEGVQVGDTVLFHVTNIEQDWDVPHGFAILGATNAELLVMPGRRARCAGRREARCLSDVLHRLLLGAAPGDAGVRASLAGRIDRRAHRDNSNTKQVELEAINMTSRARWLLVAAAALMAPSTCSRCGAST
jgi:hypothetical protein